jgi:hypothetical protein
MPSWNEILDRIRTTGSTYDVIRRDFLRTLHDKTGRNIILYYSGWLQKPDVPGMDVNDSDKNGFMTVIHRMDRSKGLDLLLHTPGGSAAATESIVDYLRQMFGTNIRAIVPQLAMSAGTMIACATQSILMGKQSSLGPIDPQLGPGVPAHGVVEEFQRAYKEIKADQAKIALWQPIIAKYHPTLVGECEKAIQWSTEMVKEWLVSGMLSGEANKDTLADKIIADLGDHALTKSHGRHLSAQKCKDIGLKVEMLEDDNGLQDAVLSVHHACIHTLTSTPATKIIENQDGVAYIQSAQTVVMKHLA